MREWRTNSTNWSTVDLKFKSSWLWLQNLCFVSHPPFPSLLSKVSAEQQSCVTAGHWNAWFTVLPYRLQQPDGISQVVGVRLLFSLSTGSPTCIYLAVHLVSIHGDWLVPALLRFAVLSINHTVQPLLQGSENRELWHSSDPMWALLWKHFRKSGYLQASCSLGGCVGRPECAMLSLWSLLFCTNSLLLWCSLRSCMHFISYTWPRFLGL